VAPVDDKPRQSLCGLRPMVYAGAERREGYATTKSATFARTIVIRRRHRAHADVGICITVEPAQPVRPQHPASIANLGSSTMKKFLAAILACGLFVPAASAANDKVNSAVKTFDAVANDAAKLKTYCEMNKVMNSAGDDKGDDAKDDALDKQIQD